MDISLFDLRIISGDFKLCVFSNIFFWQSQRGSILTLSCRRGLQSTSDLNMTIAVFLGALFLDLVEKG